jgi:hypothetical protein
MHRPQSEEIAEKKICKSKSNLTLNELFISYISWQEQATF